MSRDSIITLIGYVALMAFLITMVAINVAEKKCINGFWEKRTVCVDNNPNTRGTMCQEWAERQVWVCR